MKNLKRSSDQRRKRKMPNMIDDEKYWEDLTFDEFEDAMKLMGVIPTPESILREAEYFAIRREILCKHSPCCPKCDTDQVQLIEYIESDVAKWKCRHCRQKFYFELIK